MLTKVMLIFLMVVLLAALTTEAPVGRRGHIGRPMMGGWRNLNVTDPEVQEVAAKATAHLEGARNSAKVYRLQEVASAKYQIVRGKNFRLTLKIGQTDCFRRANVNVQNCSVVKVERCVVTVWVWQNTSQVTNFTCGKEKIAGGGGRRSTCMPMLGGEMDIEVDRDDVIQAATFATTDMRIRQYGPYRITKATSQVVTGAVYRLTLEMPDTTPDDGVPDTVICTMKVLDKAWKTPRYAIEELGCVA